MSRKILKIKGDFRCTCIEQCNKQLRTPHWFGTCEAGE